MNTEWREPTKYIVSVGLFIFGLYLIYLSSSVLTLLILAALVAFLLIPLVDFFHIKCRLPRGVAVLITYLIVGVALLLSPLIFLPPVIDGFGFLANIDYQVLVDDSLTWAETTLLAVKDSQIGMGRFLFDPTPVVDPVLQLLQSTEAEVMPELPSFATIINSLQSAAVVTLDVATNVAGTVFSGVFTLVVLILSAIYISTDAHKFSDRFISVMPALYRDEIATLMRRLNRIWRAYFRGQLTLMIIIGTATWLGNMALGLPGAFALGVIAGVMELIPNLGPFLAAVPAVIVALIQGSTVLGVSNWVFALIIIGFYILVQQFENTVVVPKVLGEAVDLHPLVVIIGVLVGANVGGILGALLAAPVIASGREIIRYLYLKILGEIPFPPGAEPEPEAQSDLLGQSKRIIIRLRGLAVRQPAISAEVTAEPSAATAEDSEPVSPKNV